MFPLLLCASIWHKCTAQKRPLTHLYQLPFSHTLTKTITGKLYYFAIHVNDTTFSFYRQQASLLAYLSIFQNIPKHQYFKHLSPYA